MKTSTRRGGYALLLVLGFITLLLSLASLAYRHVGAALRVESVRAAQLLRDEGSVHALARGVALLETGLPPSNPYVCGATIETSAGPRTFTVTFASDDNSTWSVNSTLTSQYEVLEPMPTTFANP